MDVIAWSEVFRRVQLLMKDFGVPATAPVIFKLGHLITEIETLEHRGYLPPRWRNEWPRSLGYFFPAAFAFRGELREAFKAASNTEDSESCKGVAHAQKIVTTIIEIVRSTEQETA